MMVKETYTLGGDDVFLYSEYSEYIHATKTGMKPNKKDTWGIVCENESENCQINISKTK